MNVLFLVYTSSANGKRYWATIARPTSTSGTSTNYSVLFNGTSDYLYAPQTSAAAISLPGDFTMEAWIKPLSYPSGNSSMLIAQWIGGTASQCSFIFEVGQSGNLQFVYGIGGGNGSVAGTTALAVLNQWNHVAVTRQGSTVRFFVNGVMDASTFTIAGPLNAGPVGPMIGFFQGSAFGGANTYIDGYMTDVRVVADAAVYTSDFTPPTDPLTAIPGTMLLVGNTSTPTDSSPNHYVITAGGAPTVTTQSPYVQAGDVTTLQYFTPGSGWAPITLTDPNYPTVPEAQSAQVSYTPDGQYLVMPTSTGIVGYQQAGEVTTPLTFPTQGAGLLDAKITSDSNYVVGVNTFPPYAVCYQRSTSTNYVTAGNLSTIHNSSSTCCDFSVGGNYLAVGGNALYLYKKTIATFAALASPVNQTVQAVRFSSDSMVLYVGTGSGITVLNRNGDMFTPSSWTIAGNIHGFDLYSKYLAITTDQGVTVYDTTTQTSVYSYSATTVKSVRFSTDGLHLAIEHTQVPYFEVLQWLQS